MLGSHSTLANTDTSGATKLEPALDKVERAAKAVSQDTSEVQGPGGVKYPEGMGGQGEFPGAHNKDGYYGGSTKAKQEIASKSGSSEYKASGQESSTGGSNNDSSQTTSSSGTNAPSSSNTTTGSTSNQDTGAGNLDQTPSSGTARASDTRLAEPSQKPKGKNLTEGGFDDDPSNNASFTADIGSDNDPGRVAEAAFQRRNAESGPDAGGSGPRQKEITGDGQYDVLEADQSL